MFEFGDSDNKAALGLGANKTIPINSIAGIDIKKFRSIENQTIVLGDVITVLSGRNGTMKTSMMGLIAHPFSSEAQDVFGNKLKTTLKEVFKLSPTYDVEDYDYDLLLDTGEPKLLREPVQIYWVADKTNRHRVVVSGSAVGDGNFIYNTSLMNMTRLRPMVATSAKPDAAPKLALTRDEARGLKDFYETVFPSSEYNEFTPVHQRRVKTTFAPSGKGAKYDWQGISSGEDNLGAIYNRLIGFQRSLQKGQVAGNGVLCIDEFESSLHPVAQLRLFDYLYKWARNNKVQVVIATHSLYLIMHIYAKHQANMDAKRIVMNFLSKSSAQGGNTPISKNPPLDLAYKELTFQDPQKVAEARKIKVFCEDDYAIHFAKRLIKRQHLLRVVEFHSSLAPDGDKPGTSYTALSNLCIQYPLLLEGALVLFDADVQKTVTDKIKNKALFLQLPDEKLLAIERRIILYIINMENDDPFFEKFNKERDRFLDEFKQAGIRSLSPADIANEKEINIKHCKQWADEDPAEFKKYITYYADNLEARDKFVTDFMAKVNELVVKAGLPPVPIN